jgi:hypothetical protein
MRDSQMNKQMGEQAGRWTNRHTHRYSITLHIVTDMKTSNLIPLSVGTELIWHRKGTRIRILQYCGKFIDELGNHTLQSKFSAPCLMRRIQ